MKKFFLNPFVFMLLDIPVFLLWIDAVENGGESLFFTTSIYIAAFVYFVLIKKDKIISNPKQEGGKDEK